uniref:uncharacterized protein LOC122608073 isoform X1 n=1 Tax=Erigeron canadensis TaxID=72917 RepID=UPI001CB95826|nr:uncharacterized protein LOC122608073 isoform X1 [Erigeron canadensis]
MESLVSLSMNRIRKRVVPSSVGERYTQHETVSHQCTRKMNLSSLQKLELSGWGLKDGEIPFDIGELSNLEELNLSRNDFSLLGFSLSHLTRLKTLILSECKRLVELPELPSSIAVLEADFCDSLTTIGKNYHTNFKYLCEVSILRNSRGIVDDAGKLVESMLQGMGIEIPVRNKHMVQLPENWCNDFYGLVMCVFTKYSTPLSYTIIMEKMINYDNLSEPDWRRQYVVSSGKSIGGERTWVGFVSFAALRHTSWWQETPNTLFVSFETKLPDEGFGIALVPKKSGIAPTETSTDFLAFPHLNIVGDSTSTLKILISFNSNDKSGFYVSDTIIKRNQLLFSD